MVGNHQVSPKSLPILNTYPASAYTKSEMDSGVISFTDNGPKPPLSVIFAH